MEHSEEDQRQMKMWTDIYYSLFKKKLSETLRKFYQHERECFFYHHKTDFLPFSKLMGNRLFLEKSGAIKFQTDGMRTQEAVNYLLSTFTKQLSESDLKNYLSELATEASGRIIVFDRDVLMKEFIDKDFRFSKN